MSKVEMITVEDVNVKGPYEGKYGQVYKQSVKSTLGNEYIKFTKTQAPLAMSGENLTILFEEKSNGKYTNKSIIEINRDSSVEVSEEVIQGLKESVASKTNVKSPFSAKATSQASISTVTSKDISMEVSGLLQALINTGMYTYVSETTHSVTLKRDDLSKHLEEVLSIKRNAAAALEKSRN